MDIIAYSHLRWNFVYQRPQHLLSRLALRYRVFFIEEPIYDSVQPYLENYESVNDVKVLVVHIPHGTDQHQSRLIQNDLLSAYFKEADCREYIAWYYTPMALNIDINIEPELIIYDCMDELSAFKNAPVELKQREAELMGVADIVFTGGYSLYEAKKHQHKNIHAFPSSIDRAHFEKAKHVTSDQPDQQTIPHPRIGYFGVIDERMNIDLLREMATLRPDYSFVLIGPVVKIDPAILPRMENIFYLGPKDYKELPSYIAGWDVAMMPFDINESTQFISPTKTPEYLAAGKPVVSTPVKDVVRSYGDNGLVLIANNAQEFSDAIGKAITMASDPKWVSDVDEMLSLNSWDKTIDHMLLHIMIALEKINNNNQKGEALCSTI